jgi:hypothetical protein
VLIGIWTAVMFVSFFFALRYLALAGVGSIGVGAAPFSQLALRRMDTLAIMFCMAFQPVMSFPFSL